MCPVKDRSPRPWLWTSPGWQQKQKKAVLNNQGVKKCNWIQNHFYFVVWSESATVNSAYISNLYHQLASILLFVWDMSVKLSAKNVFLPCSNIYFKTHFVKKVWMFIYLFIFYLEHPPVQQGGENGNSDTTNSIQQRCKKNAINGKFMLCFILCTWLSS